MKKIFERAFQVLAIAGLVTFNFVTPAFAIAAEDLQVLLSDSREATVSNYTITYDQHGSADFEANDTLTITFPAGFTLTALSEPGDYDFLNGATEETLQSGACGATDSIQVSVSSQDIIFEACDNFVGEAAGTVIEIQIGTNAAGGANQITNHSTAATYTITVNTTDEDPKDALIAITEGVTLSATVDETLTFTVAGANVATCTVSGGTEIDTSGDATTIPFGTVSSDTFYDACQQLTTGTNAAGGYSTTVQTTSLPTSGGNTIAKGNCEGACSDSAEAIWDTAAGNNGYGYCMDDTTGDAAATADAGWGTNGCQATASSQFHKTIANAGGAETAQSIMASAGATTSNDVTLIGYRLNIGSGQAAGTYQTTIVYICTPTF